MDLINQLTLMFENTYANTIRAHYKLSWAFFSLCNRVVPYDPDLHFSFSFSFFFLGGVCFFWAFDDIAVILVT
jgi:hypothetical protein